LDEASFSEAGRLQTGPDHAWNMAIAGEAATHDFSVLHEKIS
jgi:hypothetical protein